MPVVHNVLFSAQEVFEPLPLSLALHAVVRWCVIMSVKIKESFTVYCCLTHFLLVITIITVGRFDFTPQGAVEILKC